VRAIRSARAWPLWVLVLSLTSCIGPPLEILPTTLPNGVEDTTYSENLSADQEGVVHWEVADGALPAGLALGNETGAISGRPTETGTFSFTVSAAGEALPRRSGEQTYTLAILERLEVSFRVPAARVGEAYKATPTIVGGVPPYTVTIVGLPAGLDYNPATGTMSGTPLNDEAALRLDLSVKDTGDPQQVATARVYLEIHPVGVAITTTTLANAAAGAAYSATVEAAEGREPYTWAVTAGVLPDGLRLNTTSGTISGTPEGDAETETFTISVTDSDSPAATDTQELTIQVVVITAN
jgi:large repetitive protein